MIIDFQAHVFPENYLAEMRRRDGAVVLEEPDPHSGMRYFYDKQLKCRINTATLQGQNIELRLQHMDQLGIDVHVLTIPAPGADRFAKDDAIAMARVANDSIAAIARQHPKRFIGFFTLPTASIPASLDELVPDYLRKIPPDPITDQTDWETVVETPDPDAPQETDEFGSPAAPGVIDVKSKAPGNTLNGTPYTEL